MQEFQKRVVEEKTQLDERLEKLKIFLKTPTFKSLTSIERVRLTRQSEVMQEYSTILGQRIEGFEQPKVTGFGAPL
jgi:hypothetical protein